MGAEVKARINVDADNALRRIEEINKASDYASKSMSKMAKEIGEANAALSGLGGKMGGTASETAFKNITEQLEKQSLAYSLVDSKTKAAAESASLYRNAIINLTKSGSLTKEQTDQLVRTYNNYKTAAEAAKTSTQEVSKGFDQEASSLKKLLSVAKNILKFQLLMGPITGAIRGLKNSISDSMKVAAEAEQVFNKLATVFDGIGDSAQNAAKGIASSLGVAKSTAASAISTVGDLLQAQGMGTAESLTTATEWVKAMQDIIAFKDINMSLEEFAQTFMSGAAGNLRNFRTFGSIVKESAVNARVMAEYGDDLSESEEALAKMVTRATIALEQQSNAMGATEREWETMLSINRRLNEAWKAYKENLGQGLNELLKPMKEWLTRILEDSNKVREMFAFLNKGSDITIHIKEESFDESFKKVMKEVAENRFGSPEGNSALKNYGLSLQSGMSQIAGTLLSWFGIDNSFYQEASASAERQKGLEGSASITARELASVIVAANQTLGKGFDEAIEALDLLGYEISDEIIESAKEIYNLELSRLDNLDRQSKVLLTLMEESYNVQEYRDLVSAIMGKGSLKDYLSGSSFVDKTSLDYLIYGNKGTASENPAQAIQSMTTLLSQLTSNIEKANKEIDDYAEGIYVSTQRLSQHSKYEGNNQFTYDPDMGWTREEFDNEVEIINSMIRLRKELISMVESWTELYSETEDEIRKLYAKQDIETLIGSMTTSSGEYEKMLSRMGFTEEQNLLADIDDAYDSFVNSEEALYALGIDLETLAEVTKSAKNAISEYYAAIAEGERVAAFNDALSSVVGKGETFEIQLAQMDMTDNERQVDDLKREFQSLISTLDLSESELETLYSAYDKTELSLLRFQRATDEAAEAEKKKAAYQNLVDSINPAKTYFDAWEQGKLALEGKSYFGSEDYVWTGTGGGLIGLLIELVKNTETFQQTMSIVQDTIVPILDAVLKPMLPVIEMIRSLFDSFPWEIVLFCIKIIASTIVSLLAIVKVVMAVIKNIYVAVYNLLHRRNKMEYERISDINDEVNATLEKIWGTTLEIERNTEKGDDYSKQLALLKNLYNGGVLNLSEYTGAVAGVTGSSMGRIESYTGTSYARGSGGVTYFSGDIVINGYNGNPTELALEIERVLQRRAQAGGGTFA